MLPLPRHSFASSIQILFSHIMLYFQQLILSALPAFLFCSATNVLPRAQHAAAEPGALIEIRNVMLGAGNRPSPRNAPIPRSWDRRSVPIRDASSESPLAAIKKTLLHRRQLTCDPGYGLCNGGSLYLQSKESQARDRTKN